MAMMKRRKKPAAGGIPTASTADIAFLLLFFFLTTTVFDQERGLSIVLPKESVEVAVSQRNVLHLIVRPDGWVDVRRGESPQVQNARPNEIATIWRMEVSNNPNLIAAVRTYPDSPYRNMIAVLDQLHVAGAERVSLQLMEE